MKLHKLLNKHSDKNIIKNLVKLYPDQKKNIKGYKIALEELKNIKPIKSDFQIILKQLKDKEKKYVGVSGIDKKDIAWAIAFTSWNIWLGSEIFPKSYKRYRKLDILCYCLWEMTFNGFSNKSILKEYDKLLKGI